MMVKLAIRQRRILPGFLPGSTRHLAFLGKSMFPDISCRDWLTLVGQSVRDRFHSAAAEFNSQKTAEMLSFVVYDVPILAVLQRRKKGILN